MLDAMFGLPRSIRQEPSSMAQPSYSTRLMHASIRQASWSTSQVNASILQASCSTSQVTTSILQASCSTSQVTTSILQDTTSIPWMHAGISRTHASETPASVSNAQVTACPPNRTDSTRQLFDAMPEARTFAPGHEQHRGQSGRAMWPFNSGEAIQIEGRRRARTMPSARRAEGFRRSRGAIAVLCLLSCAPAESPAQSAAPLSCGGQPAASEGAAGATVASEIPAGSLRIVADVPLPGPPARFDYQSHDTVGNLLYLAHMGAGQVIVVDTKAGRVAGVIPGLPGVTGVWAAPELDRVYASATGLHRVAIIDARTRAIVARVGPIGFPDGIAYVPEVKKVFVSDESGGGELVIDAAHDRASGTIPLGGEAGNTIYDPGSGCVLVAVQTRNEVAAIDPATERVVGRFPVSGARHPHGLSVDAARRRLFVAGEGNARLSVIDLGTMRVVGQYSVGDDPDVLAFDHAWHRLYVASESGLVTVFDTRGDSLVRVASLSIPGAHSVSVAPRTHLVYFPLKNVKGRPVLRIMTAEPERRNYR
jgi:DNA-binding beta-propeller fold protein YncE